MADHLQKQNHEGIDVKKIVSTQPREQPQRIRTHRAELDSELTCSV